MYNSICHEYRLFFPYSRKVLLYNVNINIALFSYLVYFENISILSGLGFPFLNYVLK